MTNSRGSPPCSTAATWPRSAASRSSSSCGALAEQADGVVRRKHGQQRQGRLELEVLLGGGGDELGEPVEQLTGTGRGEGVDRALGPASLADGLGGFDEASGLQRLDHAVEGAVVEADAVVLGAAPQRVGYLVRMHRRLVEAGEHRQGQRVGPRVPTTRGSIFGIE